MSGDIIKITAAIAKAAISEGKIGIPEILKDLGVITQDYIKDKCSAPKSFLDTRIYIYLKLIVE